MGSDPLSAMTAEWVRAIDDRGELPHSTRRQIEAWLRATYGNDVGEHVWKRLELISAEHVLNRWTEVFPSERLPSILLEAATLKLEHGLRELRDGERQAATLKTLLDNKFDLGEKFYVPIYAGFAAWAAASNVVSGRDAAVAELSEMEIEPEQWDASFYASLAEAGGAVWEAAGSDDESRRMFWRWYLESALPEVVDRVRSR